MTLISINCTNIGKPCQVEAGQDLSQIAVQLGVHTQFPILCASVNNRYVGLTYRVYQPTQITFLDLATPEGRRVYIRSLTLLLKAALEEVLPQVGLHVLHAVSKGFYCVFSKDNTLYRPTEDDVERIKKCMKSLCEKSLPIIRTSVLNDDAVQNIARAQSAADLLRQHGDIYTQIYSIAGHSIVMYEDLASNTSVLSLFDLIKYFDGVLLLPPSESDPSRLPEVVNQDKMFATFVEADKWQHLLHARSIETLNKAIEMGFGTQVIHVTEALHEKKIADIADMITARRNKVRVVLIAGPSSSGKTTFSKRLAVQLVVNGIQPVNLSIDNYFVDRDKTPRDANGKYDFDALEAIDVKFFNEQLLALMDGQTIDIPKYSFTQGKRYYDGEKLTLPSNALLIIEGTHGLTPQLTPMIPAENKFKIYTAPLAGLNLDELNRITTTDNRLIRRIVRDYYNRGHNAAATIEQWPSVRRGEVKFIYANQEEADVMFNSALLYELAVLKRLAEPILLEVKPNSPHFAEAQRLLNLLSYVCPLSSDSIPPTSLMREFLGGSSFKYD